jgi:RelA/SpoT family (p)ppGpp synthetase
MNHLRQDLEDLGFRNLYPMRYRVLQESLRKRSGNRNEIIDQLEARIRDRLLEGGEIKARVLGRTKPLWSIYRKMRDKNLSFREVYDVYALRIIVDVVDTCYRVLGLIHGLYKPIMGRFKDYIAIPKANGYQSLHTALFVSHDMPIEVQIRTKEMHIMAEAGVAAHWLYKAPGNQDSGAHKRARKWLQKLLDMQRRAGDSVEFLESVKVDLFPEEVYVFTPRGEIIELPRGATAVDFAYAIHSDVGNTCVGAKVDRRPAPLRTQLSNGQTVEVIIAPTARPNPAWLSFVVTAKARASIRHYLKHLQREEAVILGKRMLEKALLGRISGIKEIPGERMAALVREFHAESFDDLLADIGLGKRLAPLIAKRLFPENDEREAVAVPKSGDSQPLLIKGTEGAVVIFGRCCRPLPGDPIMGFLSAGRGIVIHRASCKHVADYKKNPDKWLEVDWEKDISAEFPVSLRLDVINKRGVLATVAAAIAEADTNIENVNTSNLDGGVTTIINLVLNVHGRSHLAWIIRRLRLLPEVLRASRQQT